MPRIIVSYRRSDCGPTAGRICDWLIDRYGEHSVFIDIDSIPFGVDFRRHIEETFLEGDVLLAIVGRRWAGFDQEGHRRIADPDDPVRVEIELGLHSQVAILPILVDGADMPKASELPDSIRDFAYINAAAVDTGRDFRRDLERVVRSIDRILATKYGPTWQRAVRLPVWVRGVNPGTIVGAMRNPIIWAVIAALVVPFAAGLESLSPPWPRGVVVVTVMVEIASLTIAYWLIRSRSRASVNRVVVITAIILAIASCSYLLADSLFTYETPTTKERWAKGFVCTPEARLLYKDKCPYLGVDELKGAEYEAERLWTASSVSIVRVALIGLWLLAFVAMSTLVAGLVLLQAQYQASLQAAPASGHDGARFGIGFHKLGKNQ